MSANIIQANYEELEAIANRFGSTSESNGELHQRILRAAQALQQGGWEGKGIDAFVGEMEGAVFPAMQRLTDALGEAQRVTFEVKEMVKIAEEEAASVFQGGNSSVGLQDGSITVQTDGIADRTNNSTGEATQQGSDVVQTSNTASLSPNAVFNQSYMKGMIGQHFKGEDSLELNRAMEKLSENPTGAELEHTLNQIADMRGVPRDDFRAEYERFLQLRDQAIAIQGSATETIHLGRHDDFLGSTASLRYGKAVGDILGIDPVFGSLLNPSGGLVGPGNISYEPSDDSPIGYHGIFHDAAGYLYNYHNLGPGYDYLDAEPERDTSDPLTGQRSGILWWVQQNQADPYSPDLATNIESGMDNLLTGNFSGAANDAIQAMDQVKTIKDNIVIGLQDATEGVLSEVEDAIDDNVKSATEAIKDFFSW